MKNALLLAASFGVACSIAFIFGYQFHKSSQPELKGVMAGYSYAESRADLNKLFEQVAIDNKNFQTLNQIDSDETLTVAKETARKELQESLENFEVFSQKARSNHQNQLYSIMLNEVEKIKANVNDDKVP